MATKDFLPQGWSELAEWYSNFALNLSNLATKYGITPATLSAVANDNNWLQYWVAVKFTARQQEAQLTRYAEAIANKEIGSVAPTAPIWGLPPDPPQEVAPGLRKRVRQIANQIKNNSAYIEADGALLGIIGEDEDDTPADELKAAFTAHALAAYAVAVEFRKQGADAMQFEARAAGETSWSIASTKTASPAKLTFSFSAPTQLEIRAVLVEKDEPVGAYSDIVTVTIAA